MDRLRLATAALLVSGGTALAQPIGQGAISLPTINPATVAGALQKANNLSDVASAAAALGHLGGVAAAGGNAGATVLAPNLTGAVMRPLATRAADTVNVRDFTPAGTVLGGVTTDYLSAAAASGTTSLSVGILASPAVGQAVLGSGMASGTTVSAVSISNGTTTVTLSTATSAAMGVGSQIDFAPHNDTAAFSAALAAATAPGAIDVPPGHYWLAGYPGNKAGVSWDLDHVAFAQGGGIAEAIDQSILQNPGGTGSGVVRLFGGQSGEEGLYLAITSGATATTASYQKNAEHIRFIQNDKSSYSFLGDAQTDTHDLVGYSAQGECPAGNARCSLFLHNEVGLLDAGSDGPMTNDEVQILNNRSTSPAEVDSWDDVTAFDIIMGGQTMSAAGVVLQGFVSGGGPGMSDGFLIRSGSVANDLFAERVEGTRNASGVVTSHTDDLILGAGGRIFGQTLHVGGGQATNNVLPTAGLGVDANGNLTAPTGSFATTLGALGFLVTGNANGAIQLGSKTASTVPFIDFYQDGNSDYCRVQGAGGANLDVFCNGTNDLIFYTGGATWQVAPLMPGFNASAESHVYTGTYADPDPGVGHALKVAGTGAAVSGGIRTDTLSVTGTTRASGSLYLPTVTETASFAFTTAMRDVAANAASGAIAGTLPPCTAANRGLIYGLKKLDGSANAVSYAAAGSDLIDGAATLAITTQYAVATVQCSDTAGRWDKGF